MGKSALLEYTVGAAADVRVVRAMGVESEMELAYASLHLLCTPLLDRLKGLPRPQHDALGVAFGLQSGTAPDRFLVGLAVLTLLSQVAEDRPLLCVVDNAQWLDAASAQVLAFVARRLLAEPVGLVFAARELGTELWGLAEIELGGLPDQEARALLGSVVPFWLDEQVRERILAETAGNPLALLELPRRLTSAQLAGGFGLAGAVPARIEQVPVGPLKSWFSPYITGKSTGLRQYGYIGALVGLVLSPRRHGLPWSGGRPERVTPEPIPLLSTYRQPLQVKDPKGRTH